MKKFDSDPEKQLQVGAADRECVLLFRKQADERNFTKSKLLKIMIGWWTSVDFESQKEIYHGADVGDTTGPASLRDQVVAILEAEGVLLSANKDRTASIGDSVETIKHYVRYKTPKGEDLRQLQSLRKALRALDRPDDTAARTAASRRKKAQPGDSAAG